MEKYFHNTDKSLRILFLDEELNEPIGYIYLDYLHTGIWEVKTIVSHKGHAILLHREALKFIYPDFIIPYRGDNINLKLKDTYNYFINDIDIIAFKFSKHCKEYIDLPGHNDWYNRIYKLKYIPQKLFKESYKLKPYQEINSIGVKYFISKYYTK